MINTIHQGDCLEIMSRIPDNSVDLVLCDLPYGTTQNKWDNSPLDLDCLWQHYRRITKERGTIVLTAQGLFTGKLMLSAPDLFKYKIVWEKSKATNFLNAKKQPLRKHEDILVFYKKPGTYNPQMTAGAAYNKGVRKDQNTGSYGDFDPVQVQSEGQRYPVDVQYFKTAEAEGPVYHYTQKPVELARWLVRTYTNEGDLVMDNCFGSGSFILGAALESRNYIGIELNDVSKLKNNSCMIDIIQQRFKNHGLTPPLI